MSPRAVITPENLSFDFLIELLRADGPVGLNLNPTQFARHVTTGQISIIGLGDQLTTDQTGVGDGFVLRYDLTNEIWVVSDDLSPSGVKAIYESNANTHAFTDALLAKLNGVEAGAEVNLSGAPLVAAIDAALGATAWRQQTSISIKTASYVLVEADFVGEHMILMNVVAPNSVTIPAGLNVTNPVTVVQIGAGVTTIVPALAVAAIAADAALKMRVMGSTGQIIPAGTDSYLVIGDLKA